jgi:hypothetical protein
MSEQHNRIVLGSFWTKLNGRTHGLTAQRTSLIKPAVLVLLVTFAVYAQTAPRADSKRADADPRPTTDAEKIEDALSAGPLVDLSPWPSWSAP